MNDITLNVDLGSRSYPILIQKEISNTFLNDLEKFYLISDDNVASLYSDKYRSHSNCIGFSIIPFGESSKSLSNLESIIGEMIKAGADRKTTVLALGGGVIGDLSGFVASTFMRGVPFYQIPTTILSMVDSSVGGKVAVNHPFGKNTIGNFHQPKGVFIATDFIQSLSQREKSAGLAEVIKYGIMIDQNFFEWLENNIQSLLNLDNEAMTYAIKRSLEIKADIVAQDEKETSGIRALLNLGHTFAHAEETLSKYEILHGEAVAAGMVAAAKVSVYQNRMKEDELKRIIHLISLCNLPVSLTHIHNFNEFWTCMQGDKKNENNQVKFIIPNRIGECEPPTAIEKEVIQKALL